MDTRTDIINELQQLQSPLASQVPVNVFTVPVGYFEGLPAAILRAVQGDSILQTLQPPANADVPEGYFDSLASNILNKIKAQSGEDAPLSPLLESLRKTNVFTVPQGYFDNFDQTITNALSNDNETLSPTLEVLRQQQVFEVPQGYFESLADAVMAKVQQPKGRVIGFSRIIKFAAAAVVVGAMALGVYKFTGADSGSGAVGSDIPLALNNIQKEGIALSKDEAKYNAEFEKVSGDAIVEFLTANGDDVETALAAAAVNESELPSADDLMLDEKALEDFLNGNGKSSTN